jgi:very-short-patch-repair endonuclease
MLTGVLRYRSRTDRGYVVAGSSADEVLANLLRARSLRPHRFIRDCEIGPFIVDHVCVEQAVVVDLSRTRAEADARCRFLESLGYRVLCVAKRDLFQRPDTVLAHIRQLLHSA